MKKNFLKILLVFLSTALGFSIFYYFYYETHGLKIAFLGGGIGFLLSLFVLFVEKKIREIPPIQLIGGSIGLIIGLIIATLISYFFEVFAHGGWEIFLYAMSILGFGYLGMVLGGKKFEEIKITDFFEKIINKVLSSISSSISTISKKGTKKEETSSEEPNSKRCYVLDTSALIDGRIVDLCEKGFLEGEFLVPDFVMEEIHRLSDSQDHFKRQKGKRALSFLEKLKKLLKEKIKFVDKTEVSRESVDEKLVEFSQKKGGVLVTTDANLSQIGRLKGIKVLNIHELFMALRPKMEPGDTLEIFIKKTGKDKHQGIGYLEDGTMVVVERGKHLLGRKVEVVITHIHHSHTGRILFAQIKRVIEENSKVASNL